MKDDAFAVDARRMKTRLDVAQGRGGPFVGAAVDALRAPVAVVRSRRTDRAAS